jgi:inosine-uridine nucleoside N-ribohydrolase
LRAQPARRKIIIDEDCSGPGGSNLQTVAMLAKAPGVDVLGIAVMSGDQSRDQEVAHTLRLLEIMGRTDIPVLVGAESPLLRTPDEARQWQERYGKVAYTGAWGEPTPTFPEGKPTIKPSDEDAAHFMLRMVHKYPGEVTIYEGGPMTDLAQAISIDPKFPELARELVFMGGSLHPSTTYPEFAETPRHEFNFWFDPEAAFIALRAPWKRIVCTPVDISIQTLLTRAMVDRIDKVGTPLARYTAKYFQPGNGNDYMWDELAAAAWLDPSVITKSETRYMSVDIDHGAGYGNTLTWNEEDKPKTELQRVEVQVELNKPKLYDLFFRLITSYATTQ